MSKIKVINLTFQIRKNDGQIATILKNINHQFPLGKITAIVGPSGSGKTVLCKHLNGLLKPTIGQVQVLDFIITDKMRKIKKIFELRKQVGFVCQNPERQLFEETVAKEVIFGPVNFGFSPKKALTNAQLYFTKLGLQIPNLEQSPFKFSGGQKRKIALSSILAHDPQIVILDSPTSGLDLKSKEKFLLLMAELNQKSHKTIIFISHDMNEVLELADEVLILDAGKKIACLSPIELFRNQAMCQKYHFNLPDTIKFLNNLKNQGIDISAFNPRSFVTLISTLKQQLGAKNG